MPSAEQRGAAACSERAAGAQAQALRGSKRRHQFPAPAMWQRGGGVQLGTRVCTSCPGNTAWCGSTMRRPSLQEVLDWSGRLSLGQLMEAAAALRDSAHPRLVTFSPKVFIPLTRCARRAAQPAREPCIPGTRVPRWPIQPWCAGCVCRLCRDTCGYCTFAQPPVPGRRAYMTIEEVVEVARLGARQGCTEALFTLGWRRCKGAGRHAVAPSMQPSALGGERAGL